jgi:hypothetical protein
MTSRFCFSSLSNSVNRFLSKRNLWPILASLIATIAYTSTLQTIINGSGSPYTTDTGEIQNALPRWGLLHPSGYPLYSFLGSTFVTVLRLGGLEPAIGASVFSTIWALVGAGLLVLLAQELGASGPNAALGALCAALSTSMWVDASVAEVHSLSFVFTIASIFLAVRLSHSGQRRDLLWLTLIFTQGIAHQRAVAALAPAIGVLIWNQRQALRVNWRVVIAVSLLAPPVYLYLAIRKWMGVTWYFGTPETLTGLWAILHDNVFRWPDSLAVWWERVEILSQLLSDDMLWPLLITGLVGLISLAREGRYRLGLGLTLAWVPSIALTLIIWEGRISDAQLAAKLPVVVLAGAGVALVLEGLSRWRRWVGWGVVAVLGVVLLVWCWNTRPLVLSITRDPSAQSVIATAAQVVPSSDARPTALMAPWGNTYWALTYAQAYQGQLRGLHLVDHNYDMASIIERGERLLVLSQSFYVFPLSWWESRLADKLYLSVAAPGVIELDSVPILANSIPAQISFDLNEAISVRSATLAWDTDEQLRLIVYWEATQDIARAYSVAVHLLASDSTELDQPILAQADAINPVEGWYPTTRWRPGEIVRDIYTLQIAGDDRPVAVRIALYYVDPQEGFVNSRWLFLPVPKL